mmetsp:Transcript_24855/g.62411  ORF Transcript_24855/g.62411 Transcript_24855/m.62411 type:complete len:275 (+) Transcript_24855:335-1159(+)
MTHTARTVTIRPAMKRPLTSRAMTAAAAAAPRPLGGAVVHPHGTSRRHHRRDLAGVVVAPAPAAVAVATALAGAAAAVAAAAWEVGAAAGVAVVAGTVTASATASVSANTRAAWARAAAATPPAPPRSPRTGGTKWAGSPSRAWCPAAGRAGRFSSRKRACFPNKEPRAGTPRLTSAAAVAAAAAAAAQLPPAQVVVIALVCCKHPHPPRCATLCGPNPLTHTPSRPMSKRKHLQQARAALCNPRRSSRRCCCPRKCRTQWRTCGSSRRATPRP